MLSKTVLALMAAAAPIVSAVGYARVENRCDYDVFLWSVGDKVDGPHTIASGATYGEKFHRDPKTGGIALKITKEEDGLYNGDAQLIYSYALEEESARVFYDLSSVFGDAFSGERLIVKSQDTTCPVIDWKDGVTPRGSQTKDCTDSKHVTLYLCV